MEINHFTCYAAGNYQDPQFNNNILYHSSTTEVIHKPTIEKEKKPLRHVKSWICEEHNWSLWQPQNKFKLLSAEGKLNLVQKYIYLIMHAGKAVQINTDLFLELRSRLLSLELCLLLWWLRLRLRLLERDLWRWRFSRDLERVLLFRSLEAERERCLRRSRDLDLETESTRDAALSVSLGYLTIHVKKKLYREQSALFRATASSHHRQTRREEQHQKCCMTPNSLTVFVTTHVVTA